MLQIKVSQALKQANLRITPQRLAVLGALMRAEDPITVERLRERSGGLDGVTVYRMVDQFIDAGLVRSVRFSDEAVRLEYIGSRPHHHHLVCDNCGRVDDIPVKEEQAIVNTIKRQHKFKVRDHSLEFFGLCRNCQLRK